jgi:hypothetical protein
MIVLLCRLAVQQGVMEQRQFLRALLGGHGIIQVDVTARPEPRIFHRIDNAACLVETVGQQRLGGFAANVGIVPGALEGALVERFQGTTGVLRGQTIQRPDP